MRYKKITALLLILSISTCFTCSCSKDNSIQTSTPPDTSTENEAEVLSATNDTLCKDETVYMLCGSSGSVSKVIVSDWLQNGTGEKTISDTTSLDGVTVMKGNTSYTINKDNMTVWDAEGGDVYYQGTSQEGLPVDVSVSYKLDGKSVTAEELAGKSGKVTIRFDYTNNQYKTVKIDGKETQIYVPFVMLTGVILDTDIFSNVKVSNGKLIYTGDNMAVLGFAMPGLQENLDVSTKDLDIPNYVEITADAKDFSLSNTMTLATNEIFSELDSSDIDSPDDLKSSISDLADAMSQLMDGSSKLYDGLSTLLKKSNELINGIKQISDGVAKLKSGSSSLYDGTISLRDNMASLETGLEKLVSNNETLNGGAKKVFNSLLSTANDQLTASGLTVSKLTVKNYSSVLNKVITSLDHNNAYKLAYNTAMKKVTKEVEKKQDYITEQVTASVRGKVKLSVLETMKYTPEQYDQYVAVGYVDKATQAKINAAIDAQMASDDIQSKISSNVKAQIKTLIDQNMNSDEVTTQINEAVAKADTGLTSIVELKSNLDSYNQFYTGLLTYTAGVKTAYQGSQSLADGTKTVAAYTKQISDGLKTLDSAMNELVSKSSALPDGVSKLKDGSMQLSKGLKKFNKNGIQKITDMVNVDLDTLISRLKATIDVSKDYNSFSGISSDMDGNVKFIYKTDSIGK
jgi:putative membrane protein